ncbi:helix-turn-helix transcriptional regulator [Pantoea agglomerans]|uniref:helix-turn-helix domain-containing protein n=1 Tax=Enterobacter agglomerans TaxID=549 RepID=UPI00044EC395|nr:helix-turn-helix transcriptional regulator [Pantoea agglomerans]EZI31093.1 XRE family transcriptional regulator [Pantoea agglomerans]MDF9911069.1 response regulator of citrate/malate metabolism [Pantoea brenneri]
MNLDEIKSSLLSLSESERQKVLAGFALSREATTEADKPDTRSELSDLTFPTLPQLLANELKRQNITYEEMAIQIGVSLSTFKRLIAKPSSAKAINLHALLKELGIKVWLEK